MEEVPEILKCSVYIEHTNHSNKLQKYGERKAKTASSGACIFTALGIVVFQLFKRIARRDKKAFFSDQCKEIEENIRKGKTRDLFKKIGDTEGIFHAKMGIIKDRNSPL